jgi:hypothetical protein
MADIAWIDLDKVASTRCLLLGAGTLPNDHIRGLRSCFVLQSCPPTALEFKDCLNGVKPKVACAAVGH